jgi:arsenate reductase
VGDETCDVTVMFNPSCSKCRGTRDLLAERGVDADYVHYLVDAPERAELERLMRLLRIDDPRLMMRTGEPLYAELGLASAGPDELLAAITAHPILLERPIVVRGDRAVIARPPELVLEILGEGS